MLDIGAGCYEGGVVARSQPTINIAAGPLSKMEIIVDNRYYVGFTLRCAVQQHVSLVR